MIKFIFRTIVDDVASFGGIMVGCCLSLFAIVPIHFIVEYLYPDLEEQTKKDMTTMAEIALIISYTIFLYICHTINRWFKLQDKMYVHEIKRIKKHIEED